MRIVLIERVGDSATLRLTPNWLARLFGACEKIIQLQCDKPVCSSPCWIHVATRRQVRDEAILDALDFVPVTEPAKAVARGRKAAP